MSKKKAFKVGGKELGRFIKMRKSIIKNKRGEEKGVRLSQMKGK